jgi:hypothetical protein
VILEEVPFLPSRNAKKGEEHLLSITKASLLGKNMLNFFKKCGTFFLFISEIREDISEIKDALTEIQIRLGILEGKD